MSTTMPRVASPSPSQVPLPASPTYTYASTANQLSSYSLPLPPPPRPTHAVLTKADLAQSQQAYADLLTTAKSYRQALAALSTASSAFGSALESCARLKESRADALGPSAPGNVGSLTNSYTAKGSCTADLLLGASGVHHLIANHQQILSETVYRSFEVPLLHELDKWRGAIDDEDETYEREVAARSKEIRRLEKDGLKLHRQRRRDVGKFREHLVELTGKLDGLTSLNAQHARTLLRESQETSARIRDASCSLVRAEVDIFEGLARKGWTGGGLDDLLEKGQDLFASEEDALLSGGAVTGGVAAGSSAAAEGAKLFSILPPKSILADSASGDSGGVGPGARSRGHARADSLLVENDRYQSLAGAVVERSDRDRDDADSIFSDFNQGRGVRPFSPQPIRRHLTDVIMDPESLLQGSRHSEIGDDNEEDDDDDEPHHTKARDASAAAQGLEIKREGDEYEVAVSPWRNEGLGDVGEVDNGNDSRRRQRLMDSMDDSGSTTKERERRWSVAEE
ncbi:hypothetical protein F4778DRAFT_764363 [Xylariomycetidae sp. FL2044]|nr:hypothetical protein F4778DRAFT_764363 [Xylariomycetidae sp. FL2044]